jgi:hypothetical protein
VKPQHNIGGRNAFVGKDLGDRRFCTVVLNSDFAILDIKVQDETKNAFLIFPADVGKLVMIVFGVTNNFSFYVIRVGVGMGLFGENLLNYLAVLLKLIHALSSSLIGS